MPTGKHEVKEVVEVVENEQNEYYEEEDAEYDDPNFCNDDDGYQE